MQTPSSLNQLLRRGDVWRGRRALRLGDVRPSGFAELDRHLVGGGWPLGALVEIGAPRLGSGEWLLLSRSLRDSAAEGGYLLLVNPPALPCGAALAQLGIPLERLLVVRASQRNELLAAVLEGLNAGCIRLLLFWESRRALSYAELRKVQLAASHGHSLCIALSTGSMRSHSPAALRLALQPRRAGAQVYIRRQRGGDAGLQVTLPWPANWALRTFDESAGLPLSSAQQQARPPVAAAVLPLEAPG
ncbi:translesion DNA synthesis-associated protein ImuA [Parahaliea aestuarii]|uniref:Translesion DNA synthesis-associated protein ImuA n=1 Tax=Parahaliea aestuarii TaxID=1852021 RepID=A0A5C8ZSN2_9GAMM|nr:translesion DNA synthesis-associated protein ImuA [Parahaliea aestuarii]TXS91466.1 translesion DNA synthesis-associated protein ImuA [Parahaliea aestuarii]